MLFYKNYYNVIIVVRSLKSMCVPSFIVIVYCVSELHGRYCNALPEAVYCFTRTTLFTKLFTCLYDHSVRLLSYLLLYTLWFLRYNVAKCTARGCLFLFYKNYIVYLIVYMFL